MRIPRRGVQSCPGRHGSSRYRRGALWVVLDGKLDHASDIVIGEHGRESKSGINTSGHPGAGQISAVLDPALRHVGRPEPVQEAVVGPVGGRRAALEEAGAGEKQ